MKQYDVIIIGGGPAGLTAGLYAARARLNVLLLERLMPGGQAAVTYIVENYPGFDEAISGAELMQKMERQARGFGLKIELRVVEKIALADSELVVDADGGYYRAQAVILATGAEPNLLGVPGEQELRGHGVSYCATCDGPLYRGQEVAVVGGGNSAVDEGIFLAKFATKVYIIHRREQLRAEKILQERALGNEKIQVLWNTVVTAINGNDSVHSLDLKNVESGDTRTLSVPVVFIYVGTRPNAGFVDLPVERNKREFVITDHQMRTSVPGLFAVGDVRAKALRQIATAVGDGATAAFAAQKYLEGEVWRTS